MKTIIIGGSATGMGVAAKLKRLNQNQEIVVYQNHDYVSLGACGLPYFVAGNFEDEQRLLARSLEQFKDSGINIVINTTVKKIDFKSKTIFFENFEGKTGEDSYDDLVIAVGAKPIVPDIKGVESKNIFTLTSLEDGIKIKETIKNDKAIKKIAIIGAGFIGLEMCETFVGLGKKVSLIEMSDHVSSRVYDPEISIMIEDEIKDKGVDLNLSSQLTEIISKDSKVTAIKLLSGKIIEVDAVLMSIGFTPNTEFLKNSDLELSKNNAIVTNEFGKTNISNVWSAGDCATSKHFITGEDIYSPLATVAAKFSKVVAENINGGNSKFIGSLQTSIIRVFEKEVARTGLTETDAKAKKIDFTSVTIKDKDHTNYINGQTDLILKLIMDNKTKNIIGSQMVGSNKSVIRINSIVSLIWLKAQVNDNLEQIDLPYAPPFSKTNDILHIALSKLNKKKDGK